MVKSKDNNDNPIGRLLVDAQYVKDLSFENPSAPQSLGALTAQPKIDLSVDIKTHQLAKNSHEVTLTLRAESTTSEENLMTLFIVELTYAGIFTIELSDESMLKPALLIECPRLLFPFARNIIADAVREGGFPPLMIHPIDFAALYRERINKESETTH